MGIAIADVVAELEKVAKGAAAASALVREGLLAQAKRGAAYAQSIAPVGDRAHTLPSGYVDEPGDYRDSISGEVVFEKGAWRGRVIARDYKAHWIEYGTRKMPKQAVMRRAAAHLRGAE